MLHFTGRIRSTAGGITSRNTTNCCDQSYGNGLSSTNLGDCDF